MSGFSPMIEIEGLSKRYGVVKVIYDISLNVKKGEVIVLLGPNGSGKSTLLKCILGLVKYQGKIHVDGLDVKKKGKEIRKKVTYIPQQFALYPNLSVIDNLRFYADINGIDYTLVKQSIEQNRMDFYTDIYAKELSEGTKQKMMLSIVSLADKPILLFDEPTLNLDLKRVIEFKEMIKAEKKKNKTIILSTHYLSDVRDIADKVLMINKGKLIFKGNLDDLLKKIKMNTRITILLKDEINSESKDSIKAILSKYETKNISIENRLITVLVDTSNKIKVLKALEETNLMINDFQIFEPGLEDVFLMNYA